MKFGKGHTIYFLGIGGIGMSALARYFNHLGATIYGYDRTSTHLTKTLEKEGMKIHYHDAVDELPEVIDLAIYTPAIPVNHTELQWIRQNNIPLLKRAAVLGQLSMDFYTIAIAGTHGKTTITSMIAHILHGAGKNITAFIGGISNNFNSNLVLSEKVDFFVVEADEFDKSFLQLRPDIAIISSVDADHLDIYETNTKLLETYTEFGSIAAGNGSLIVKAGVQLTKNIPFSTYGIDDHSTLTAQNILIRKGKFEFDLCKGNEIVHVVMQIGGRHNIENALAAVSAALLCGVNLPTAAALLQSYSGVWRRFDLHISNEQITYIDDYAHHPEEIRACISAARELFPNKKITGVFQPHLYSRTRDFLDAFAQSLSMLDELILLDIYPARELPIEGITSEVLLEKVQLNQKQLLSSAGLISFLEKQKPEILITMGAGDIDQLVAPIKSILLP